MKSCAIPAARFRNDSDSSPLATGAAIASIAISALAASHAKRSCRRVPPTAVALIVAAPRLARPDSNSPIASASGSASNDASGRPAGGEGCPSNRWKA